jgi:hypothetical protein
MPRFSFHVSQGKFSDGSTETACESREAARQQCAGYRLGLARDAVRALTPNSEWRMEVRNEAGETQFCIRIVRSDPATLSAGLQE